MSKPFDPPQYPKLWGGAHQLSERKVKGLHLSVPQMPFAASNRVNGAIGYRKGDFDAVVRDPEDLKIEYFISGSRTGDDEENSAVALGAAVRAFKLTAPPIGILPGTINAQFIPAHPRHVQLGQFVAWPNPIPSGVLENDPDSDTAAIAFNLGIYRLSAKLRFTLSRTIEYIPITTGARATMSVVGPFRVRKPEGTAWRTICGFTGAYPDTAPAEYYMGFSAGFSARLKGDRVPLAVQLDSDGAAAEVTGLGYLGLWHYQHTIRVIAKKTLLGITSLQTTYSGPTTAVSIDPLPTLPLPFFTVSYDLGDTWEAVDADAFMAQVTLNWPNASRSDSTDGELPSGTRTYPLTATKGVVLAPALNQTELGPRYVVGMFDATTNVITYVGTLPFQSVLFGGVPVNVFPMNVVEAANGEFAISSSWDGRLSGVDRIDPYRKAELLITKDFVTFDSVFLPTPQRLTGELTSDRPGHLVLPVYEDGAYRVLRSTDSGRTWKPDGVITAGDPPSTILVGEYVSIKSFDNLYRVVQRGQRYYHHGGFATAPWAYDDLIPAPENFPR